MTIINKGYVTLLVKRITNFNTDHQEGWENIPNMCIKVKHGNGFAWFGINIINYENIHWSGSMKADVIESIEDVVSKTIDLEYIVSDMGRIVDSILEVVNERKINVLLFNNKQADGWDSVDTNAKYLLMSQKPIERQILLALNLTNGVSFEIYEDAIDEESLSYGGFAMVVKTENTNYPAVLFHRNIILNHYISEQTAEEVVSYALNEHLGNMFDINISAEVIKNVERNRKPSR